MESSVHFIAALRLVANACGLGEPINASGIASHAKPDLPGPDTLVGVLRYTRDPKVADSHSAGSALTDPVIVPASVSISFAACNVKWSLMVSGTEGCLEVTRGGWGGSRGEYTLTIKQASDAQPTVTKYPFSGCEGEFATFTDMVGAGAGAAVDDADTAVDAHSFCCWLPNAPAALGVLYGGG